VETTSSRVARPAVRGGLGQRGGRWLRGRSSGPSRSESLSQPPAANRGGRGLHPSHLPVHPRCS